MLHHIPCLVQTLFDTNNFHLNVVTSNIELGFDCAVDMDRCRVHPQPAALDTHPLWPCQTRSKCLVCLMNKHVLISSVNQSLNCHNTAAFRGHERRPFIPLGLFLVPFSAHISLVTDVEHKWNGKVVNKHIHCSKASRSIINQEEVVFNVQTRAVNTDPQDSEQLGPPLNSGDSRPQPIRESAHAVPL